VVGAGTFSGRESWRLRKKKRPLAIKRTSNQELQMCATAATGGPTPTASVIVLIIPVAAVVIFLVFDLDHL
jgi:hypothetical protein